MQPYLRPHPHTFHCGPPAFRGRTILDFSRWDRTDFSDFLADYVDHHEPFYLAPPETFIDCATEEALAELSKAKQELEAFLCALEDEGIGPKEDKFFELHDKFREMSTVERQKLLHLVWWVLLNDADARGLPYDRLLCPELHLASFDDDSRQLLEFMSMQLRFTKSQTDFRVVRNPDFEAMFDPDAVVDSSAKIPPSRGLRAFVEMAYVRRHLCLATFSVLILRAIDMLVQAPPQPSIEPFYNGLKSLLSSVRQSASSPGLDKQSCDSCGASGQSKKLVACGRCKEKANKFIYYCGSVCQKAAWKTHKPLCGKLHSETTLLPAFSRIRDRTVSPHNMAAVAWLMTSPLAVWGRPDKSADLWDDDEDLLNAPPTPGVIFNLPLFVSPFRRTLAEFKDIRNRMLLDKKDRDIGIIALYIQKGFRYASGTEGTTMTKQLKHLAFSLNVDERAVERAMNIADLDIRAGREGLELVKLCFSQLDSGTSDPSHPAIDVRPAALPFFTRFLLIDDTFWVHRMPSILVRNRKIEQKYRWTTLPEFLQPQDAIVEAARELAFRGFESNCRDRHAMGVYALLVAATSRIDPSSPSGELAGPFKAVLMEMVEEMFGFTEDEKGTLTEMRVAALAWIETQDGEEWALLKRVLKDLDKEYDNLVQAGVLKPAKARSRPAQGRAKREVRKKK
ncbi:hypothetical protein JCM10213_007594 [Rhodosporidiobolus nylandii]